MTQRPRSKAESGDSGDSGRAERGVARRCWGRKTAGLLRLARDQRGATALEFALLLAAVVLPSYAIIRVGLMILAEHYRLIVTLNALPMP